MMIILLIVTFTSIDVRSRTGICGVRRDRTVGGCMNGNSEISDVSTGGDDYSHVPMIMREGFEPYIGSYKIGNRNYGYVSARLYIFIWHGKEIYKL